MNAFYQNVFLSHSTTNTTTTSTTTTIIIINLLPLLLMMMMMMMTEHVLRKIDHCTFGRKISQRPFFTILPLNCTFYLSKILMTFFLVVALFYDFLAFHI